MTTKEFIKLRQRCPYHEITFSAREGRTGDGCKYTGLVTDRCNPLQCPIKASMEKEGE